MIMRMDEVCKILGITDHCNRVQGKSRKKSKWVGQGGRICNQNVQKMGERKEKNAVYNKREDTAL